MKSLAAVLVLMSLSIPAHASGTDADLEAIRAHDQAVQEKAASDRIADENRKKQEAAITAEQNARTAAAVHPQLGKAAEGKSDAEVIRMYEAKVAREDKQKPQDEAAIRNNSEALTQKTLGKSMQDMQNMSDEDMAKMEEQIKNNTVNEAPFLFCILGNGDQCRVLFKLNSIQQRQRRN